MLTNEEQLELLRIAREAIHSALLNSDFDVKPQVHEALNEHRGAFVTLRVDQSLRGCVGFIEADRPLAEVVADLARKSAQEDTRFVPVSVKELDRMTIEISILSHLKKMTGVEEIEIGKNGLVLHHGRHRGLLLPQVATEYGWDKFEFLEAVSQKAGLDRDAWKDPHAEIFLFTAEIIEEAGVLK